MSRSRSVDVPVVKKPSLLIIFLSVFIDLIGFGIVLPLLPKYSERFGAHGYQIGLIISSFSIMQFFFVPWWGRLSDRIGRRPVILISNASSAVSYALFGVASLFSGTTGLVLLLASRVFAGMSGSTVAVASAYIADITPPEKRSKGMGLIGMAFGLGFIFGPAIGGLSAAKLGLAGPGWIAAGLCAFNFVLGSCILVESLKPNSEPATPRPKLEQWVHTFQLPKVGLLISIFFLATFCFTCFESTLPLLLDKQFHYDERHVGFLFAYCGLVGAMIQGGAIGRLVKKFGEAQLIFGSLIIVAVSMAMIPFTHHLGGLLIALALFSAGSGIARAPTMGLISIHTPASEQGATLGVAQSAGTVARIFGPVFATGLYAVRTPLPYVICAVVALGASLIAWQYLCRNALSIPAGKAEHVA
ncbi:MAG: MFS transporter [Verrucomicrobiota bacterium]